jgi:hypothetical protein
VNHVAGVGSVDTEPPRVLGREEVGGPKPPDRRPGLATVVGGMVAVDPDVIRVAASPPPPLET